MLTSWTNLGRKQIEVEGYVLKLSLMWDDGKYRLHVDFWREGDSLNETTVIEKTRVRTETEYVGAPGLLDRLLGRAEKRTTGTNAESFMLETLEKAKNRIKKVEKGRGSDLDEEKFDRRVRNKLTPVSSWADIEGRG